MYGWLSDALQHSSQVITANRRLARILAQDFARLQVQSGHLAWRSPEILSWQDWLAKLVASADIAEPLPTRINADQSRVLWERCLRREVSDPLLNIAMLVRQSRESWSRLHEFCVPLAECEAAALGRDQKIFIAAASSYQSILQRENWVDETGMPKIVVALLGKRQVRLPDKLSIAGFDRFTPAAALVMQSLRDAGCTIEVMSQPRIDSSAQLAGYENVDAEMRAAGFWARARLLSAPRSNVAIVVTGLEHNSERCARLIREGLTPGWQTAVARVKTAVNVSYGRQLSAYPAIAVAVLALRWLHRDLSSRDISTLLRSPAFGSGLPGGRSRLELLLRQVPDRNWSPSMLLDELQGRDKSPGALDWCARLRILHELRAAVPQRDTPSKWAVLVDATLRQLNWPGDGSLDSAEYQLINRWKELLNDVARLELVTPTMTLAEVLSRLLSMAGETIFQPESDGAIVQVLGPLEAAGMCFDALWVTGLSAANWPPAGRPSLLISRQLQRDYGMPDADPDDTLDYANRVLQRLLASAPECICSYPMTDGDAEQGVSGLLPGAILEGATLAADPGWYAGKLTQVNELERIAVDPVPAVKKSERVAGGAATIQNQAVEPFTAFALGRLGVRSLAAIDSGLSASLRGILIHDALRALFAELPAQQEINAWPDAEVEQRIAAATKKAFRRYEKNADAVLVKLLALERRRVAQLLTAVVELDRERRSFAIAAIEAAIDFCSGEVRLGLRTDRIDRLDDGSIVILDYKTGARKQFLDREGEPKDLQLLVYACAATDVVADLCLVNIDSRGVDLEGAGRNLTPELDWDAFLRRWTDQVADLAADLQRGDVRVDALQSNDSARALALLSRITELRHGD